MSHPTRQPPRLRPSRTRLRWAALLTVPALLTAACTSSGRRDGPVVLDSTPASTTGFDGDVLAEPITLTAADSSVSFRSTAGTQTTLARAGQGKLMLLYFGYTHCPDVCPTTMADLGEAIKQLPSQEQFHTQVVFVTSDPARDTPPVLKSWLSNFDTGLPVRFLGLTASISQIDQVAKSLGVPLSPPVKNPDGSITVEHGAQTLAFLHDKASLLWLAGTTSTQYAHDIAALLTH
jgi:protein SCO1/2